MLINRAVGPNPDKNKIPAKALRGCIDRFTDEYFYVGRTRPEPNGRRYLTQGREWRKWTEPVLPRFGKVR